jgi:hypothetical protein
VQELSLVSWRLVLIDLLMMVYLLGVLGVTMVIGIDVDVNVVANALFKYVTWTTVYISRGKYLPSRFYMPPLRGNKAKSNLLKLLLLRGGIYNFASPFPSQSLAALRAAFFSTSWCSRHSSPWCKRFSPETS